MALDPRLADPLFLTLAALRRRQRGTALGADGPPGPGISAVLAEARRRLPGEPSDWAAPAEWEPATGLEQLLYDARQWHREHQP